MRKLSIGIDFGTESARGLLLDLKTGETAATSVFRYPHGVIDEKLPGSDIVLPPDWALQHPGDWLEALGAIPRELRKSADVHAEEVVGVGVDFTSCTMLPANRDGVPLCLEAPLKRNPHAWAKLWKHHAAQKQADRINEVARRRREPFLKRYGGQISCEWFFPKALQILEEAPEIYRAADILIEGADWITLQLTRKHVRSACCAGYKAMWEKRTGFPRTEFFRSVHPEMENIVAEKLSADIRAPGEFAAGLTQEMSNHTGLAAGTTVAVPAIDAHTASVGGGLAEPGKLLIAFGTSFCHMALAKDFHIIPGISGVVEDGIVPGYFGYEGGQAGSGDILAWFVEHGTPANYETEAKASNVDVYALLERKAAAIAPGESGLLALDWWNGVRFLGDADLTGLLLGMTLATRPEEIYRALLESTAFGTRMIIEQMTKGGVRPDEIYACGGLANKNRLLMQIFADVTGMRTRVSASQETTAFGAAIFGAVAAGPKKGGFQSIRRAARQLARFRETEYTPDPARKRTYDRLYQQYKVLHKYFGTGPNAVMKYLKRLRTEVRMAKQAP